ncbi:hypothetical protein T8K17_24070 [Thalassobaculum sp. OXR-137]|uniref:hypothetical protein n=1 Tax=Thalassobaculum sp. OXR-137 TaxID=3100173 RepID=UPI002AC9F0F9|nr:hypothetical protein [Thalassobaculum sp. OXR-137]WPZ34295.1 hypothetical protein T8K17_24070 [Thalassobaculum sp. OXR-137]
MAQPSELRPARRSTAGSRTPICRLTTGEALIVWAIRHWVQSVKARLDPRDLLRCGFATIEAEDVSDAVDRLLMVTLREATTVRDVGCLRCPTLGDGERDILEAVALSQRGRREEAMAVVQSWLPLSAALRAYDDIATIGRALTGVDMTVPVRRKSAPDIRLLEGIATHPESSPMLH